MHNCVTDGRRLCAAAGPAGPDWTVILGSPAPRPFVLGCGFIRKKTYCMRGRERTTRETKRRNNPSRTWPWAP